MLLSFCWLGRSFKRLFGLEMKEELGHMTLLPRDTFDLYSTQNLSNVLVALVRP